MHLNGQFLYKEIFFPSKLVDVKLHLPGDEKIKNNNKQTHKTTKLSFFS